MDHLSKVIVRQKIITLTRQFFADKNFQEITTPVLVPALPLEPNVYSFSTNWSASKDKLYLATSPESSLKKLLASGLDNCFSISHCFRNLEGSGPTHQPEFLMLEFYQNHSDYISIMKTIQDLCNNILLRLDNKTTNRTSNVLNYQNQHFNLTPPWPQISLSQLFWDYAGVDLPQNLDWLSLQKTARAKGYQVSDADTWESLFDQIFLNEIDPHLRDLSQPLFITGYPTQISPLCQPDPDHSGFAKRFELYFGSLEIANGCSENANVSQIQSAAAAEVRFRRQSGLPYHESDQVFTQISGQLSGFAGAGLGLDRLAMLFTDTSAIDQIIPFPLTSDLHR